MVASTMVNETVVGLTGKIVKISLKGSAMDISVVPAVFNIFKVYFDKNVRFFIIDLKQLTELSASLVILLLEMASMVRRQGGDVKIINIKKNVREEFLNFNPLNVLGVSRVEDSAILEFEKKIKELYENETAPISTVKDEAEIVQHKVSEATIEDTLIGSDDEPEPNVSQEISELDTDDEEERGEMKIIEIEGKVNQVYQACNFVLDVADSMGFGEGEQGKIKIAVYEGCLNAIEHGYHSDSSCIVKVGVQRQGRKLIVTVHDEGEGFEFDDKIDFDIENAAHEQRTGGMGLHIIKKSMDKVEYINDPIYGNKLIMTKIKK